MTLSHLAAVCHCSLSHCALCTCLVFLATALGAATGLVVGSFDVTCQLEELAACTCIVPSAAGSGCIVASAAV